MERSVMLAVGERLAWRDRIPAAEGPTPPWWQTLRHPKRLIPSGVVGGISQAARDCGRVPARAVMEIARLLPEASRGGAR